MESIEITDTNLQEVLDKDGITVLDFWAEWCGPCRMVGAMVDQLAANNKNIQVGKVNVDTNRRTAFAYNIRSIPTIIFFKDGKMITQVTGAQPLIKLQEIINNLS